MSLKMPLNLNIWPYLEIALHLKNKKRKGFGNMFRHQIDTFGILLEFGYHKPVLLKAALIHDLLEDGEEVGFHDFEDLKKIDENGKDVIQLVKEVSIRIRDNNQEPREQFLERIMKRGSENARVLKLADRLSNINSLVQTKDKHFISRYISETNKYILPYASGIDENMARELIENLNKIDIKD